MYPEPWPRFYLEGVPDFTDQYKLRPELNEHGLRSYDAEAGSWVFDQISPDEWVLRRLGTVEFEGSGKWPWLATWESTGTYSGALEFEHQLDFVVMVDLEQQSSPAAVVTSVAGPNNEVGFQGVHGTGRLGNSMRVRYSNPGSISSPISVTVEGLDITVTLATNSGGSVISTANQVRQAIVDSKALELLLPFHVDGNNGTGVVAEMPFITLSGGLGGLPDPPRTVHLSGADVLPLPPHTIDLLG